MPKLFNFYTKQAGDTWHGHVLQGFAKRAQELGLDPDMLLKLAQQATATPLTKKPQTPTLPPMGGAAKNVATATPPPTPRPLVAPPPPIPTMTPLPSPVAPAPAVAPLPAAKRPASLNDKQNAAYDVTQKANQQTINQVATMDALVPSRRLPTWMAPTIATSVMANPFVGTAAVGLGAGATVGNKILDHFAPLRGHTDVTPMDRTRVYERISGGPLTPGMRDVSRMFRKVVGSAAHDVAGFGSGPNDPENNWQKHIARYFWGSRGSYDDLKDYNSEGYRSIFGTTPYMNADTNPKATPLDPNRVLTNIGATRGKFAPRFMLPNGGVTPIRTLAEPLRAPAPVI